MKSFYFIALLVGSVLSYELEMSEGMLRMRNAILLSMCNDVQCTVHHKSVVATETSN